MHAEIRAPADVVGCLAGEAEAPGGVARGRAAGGMSAHND